VTLNARLKYKVLISTKKREILVYCVLSDELRFVYNFSTNKVAILLSVDLLCHAGYSALLTLLRQPRIACLSALLYRMKYALVISLMEPTLAERF